MKTYDKPPRVVVVEDDPIVAMDLEESLLQEGFDVLSAVSDFGTSLQAAEAIQADLFTLDYNLGQKTSEPIAEVLRRRSIPFVVISGQVDYIKSLPVFQGVALLHKPFRLFNIIEAIRTTIASKPKVIA